MGKGVKINRGDMKLKNKDIFPIIKEEEIFQILKRTRKPSPQRVREILDKARLKRGLELEEISILANTYDPELIEEIFQTAKELKREIYGDRVVLFAPLYVTNRCVNNCLYCGFRRDNKETKRKTLSLQEIEEQVSILEEMGHKRLLLVFGEDPSITPEKMYEMIRKVYETKNGKGEIRRVNVNCAPLDVEGFKILKSAGIGTYQLFQETYHRESYRYYHPSGPKADYDWRITSFDRAMSAGIDDVGLGFLFGLYDWKFELLALIQHANYLDKEYNVGPHTISFPRIKPAKGAPLSYNPPYPVDDLDFKKAVAIVRLSLPYTGMILSTRESPKLRDELFHLGISQISAGSSTEVGGYKREDGEGQFSIEDRRSLDEIVHDLLSSDFIPSFCTACYRSGRTGERFMSLAKPGEINRLCTPNALLTLKEYLIDYARDETRRLGEGKIDFFMDDLPEEVKNKFFKLLKRIENGERDLYL